MTAFVTVQYLLSVFLKAMTLLGIRNLESKGDTKFITRVSTSKSPPLRPRYELRLVYGIFQTAGHLASWDRVNE